MKIRKVYFAILMTMMLCNLPTHVQSRSSIVLTDLQRNIETDQSAMGLIVLDNMHMNDYSATDLTVAKSSLEDLGYVVRYSSNFSSWDEAVSKATYLVMDAVYQAISPADIQTVVDWFTNTSANLLFASRGDFANIDFASMNTLLSDLGATVRMQDDNVYTTNPDAYREWYVEAKNFNTENYPSLFSHVSQMNFFSPSSVTDTPSSDVLVYAEPQAYQTDQTGNPPGVVYDDTNDGVGGDRIPLSVLENVTVGSDQDRIVLMGTTMWSNFDYGDPDNQDTFFFSNILDYFRLATLDSLGSITVDIPDTEAPKVKIESPHDKATLKGTITVQSKAMDPWGIASTEIYLDGNLESSTDSFVWDTTTTNDGQHQIKVVAKDPSGNTAEITNTYTVDQSFQTSLSQEPKVMTYNIKQSGAFAAWFDVVKEENPDVLLLVETGDFDNNNNAILNSVKGDLNSYFFDEIAYNAYTLQGISENYNGISLLSRYPILSSEKIDTVKSDAGSDTVVPLPFLQATLDINSETVHIVGTHLTAGPTGATARNTQTEGILNYMDSLGDVPLLFLGDFNADSPYDKTTATSDLGIDAVDMIINSSNPKASTVHTFVDAYHQLHPDSAGVSYPSYSDRIDYIFLNQRLSDLLTASTVGDTASAKVGSDHYSVDAILDISGFGTPPISSTTTTTTSSTTNTSSSNKFPINSFILPFVLVMAIAIRQKQRRKN